MNQKENNVETFAETLLRVQATLGEKIDCDYGWKLCEAYHQARIKIEQQNPVKITDEEILQECDNHCDLDLDNNGYSFTIEANWAREKYESK